MSSILSLRNGDLQGTLKALQVEVRDNPADPKHRIFLFQLLCILGQWDRALNQLNVVRELSAQSLSLAQTYQETLYCESLRSAVFAGARSPLLFGEPEPWMAMMFEALKLFSQGSKEEGDALRTQALEQAPTTAGLLRLHPAAGSEKSEPNEAETIAFNWLADADSRIGPFLEAIVHGKYFWIPFQRIRTLILEKATDLRDLVWLPARLQWINGGDAVAFIPTRYPGSEKSTDDHIQLGWKTTWSEGFPGVYQGQGQRILATDVDEYPITNISRVEFQIGSSLDG